MEATSLSHFKSGDIIKMNAIFGMSAIGIFHKVDTNTNILFCYCASYEDLRERVYFSRGERFCAFTIDGIIQVDYATNFEIKTLYNKIIGQYEKEEKDLYDYFSDSTYFELKDWFAYNCGINNEDGNYPSFVDEFVAYAWKVLCEKTNNVEEHKTESQMVNINDVCKWLDKHITDYQSDMMGYVAYEQISDIINDLKKTFNN